MAIDAETRSLLGYAETCFRQSGGLFDPTSGVLRRAWRFDAAKVLEVIQRDRVTLFYGVPTMFFGLLHHPDADKYDTSSLRLCGSGGASLPGEVLQAFEKKFKDSEKSR